MKEKTVSLSNNGLQNIHFDDSDEFVFYVGDVEYRCSKYQADFISPAVSRIHLTDPSANQFIINVRDSRHLFKKIVSLMKGRTITLSSNELKTLLRISKALQNNELTKMIFSTFNMKESTTENVVSILHYKAENSVSYRKEIDFIASNLTDINIEDLKSLDYCIMRKILSNSKLRIENEDFLMSFIYSLADKNPEFLDLLEFVQFQYVSQLKMTEFITNFDFGDMSIGLWNQLCRRLVECPSLPTPRLTRFVTKAKFAINEKDPLNGIIQSLNRNCNGNAHQKKSVVISASSNKFNACWQVINSNWDDKWYSQNEEGSWWMIDFKDKKAAVNGYTIKTDNCGPDSDHLKSWKIEGSNNKINWHLIDEQKNTHVLNGKNLCASFTCNLSHPYQFLKLTQTTENHNHFNFLVLNGIEFFGTLYTE